MAKQQPASVCHINIPAKDLAEARRFYTSVFGWKCKANLPMPKYWMFDAGAVGGGFYPAKAGAGAGIVLYLAVEDIPATLKKIVKAGGKKLTEKIELPQNFGFMAEFRDPNGNKMGLWSKQ